MGKVINLFKNKVPCTSKVKKVAGFNNKNNQVKLLIELKKEFLQMTGYNYANRKTIHNIFEYLIGNIVSNDYTYLKNIINVLVQIYSSLENEMVNCNSLELTQCYDDILCQIKLFEMVLAKRLNKNDAEELERIILFEKLSYIILEKRDIRKSVKYINNNTDILNYYNYEGKDFEHLLFEKYIHAKLTNDLSSLVYYTSIIKHIMNLNRIRLNRRKFSDILNESKGYYKDSTMLDKKLQSLKYNHTESRFILEDEIIMSIDSNGTKNIDDALSVERLDNGGYILGIHVADICSLASCNEQILTGKRFPSYNYTNSSLDERKNRNAITLFIEIDNNGVINDYRIVKSNIYVCKNLFHNDVKNIIKKGKNNDLTKFVMDLVDLYMIIDNSNLTNNPSPNSMGALIIEKFMLLFGCIISKYFDENNLPYIYTTRKGNGTSYSLYEKDYNTGFEKMGLYTYGRGTSPIIDVVSRTNQVLIYEYLLSQNKDKKIYGLENKLNDIVDSLTKK